LAHQTFTFQYTAYFPGEEEDAAMASSTREKLIHGGYY